MKRVKPHSRFGLCVHAEGSDDLEPRKIYQLLPDRAATREGYVRVIDESGEDYLYPTDYFVPVRLPAAVAHELEVSSATALQPATATRRRVTKTRLRAGRG